MSQFIQQDLIIRGGQNVYPAEVEYFLHTHPKIQDAQVKRIIEAGVCKAYCKISWFFSGEQINYLPSLFFNEYSRGLQTICHFHGRAVARRTKAWFHVYAWGLVFKGRGKPEYPEKNLSEQRRELTINSTHMSRRRRDLTAGHIGGRRVLSPLCYPCFHICIEWWKNLMIFELSRLRFESKLGS